MIFYTRHSSPLCVYFPEMTYGSLLNDKGNFVLDEKEKDEILKKYPDLENNSKKIYQDQKNLFVEKQDIVYI